MQQEGSWAARGNSRGAGSSCRGRRAAAGAVSLEPED